MFGTSLRARREEETLLESWRRGDGFAPGAGHELGVNEKVAEGEVGEDGFEELGDFEDRGEWIRGVGGCHYFGRRDDCLEVEWRRENEGVEEIERVAACIYVCRWLGGDRRSLELPHLY